MKLPEKTTSGKVNASEIRLLLYGPPKIGKTAFASGFPGAAFAATEKGYKALKVHKNDIKDWEDFQEWVDLMIDDDHDFKTGIIDTADTLFDLCSQYTCDKLGIEHESEAEWGKGWNEVKKEFTRTVNKLMMSNLGLIFISHTKGDKVTTAVTEITKTVPTLSNAARKILLPLVDTIGCMQYKTFKSKEKKGAYIERLVINFQPSEFIEAGDRTGRLPAVLKLKSIPSDIKRTSEVVAKYAKMNYELFSEHYE